MRQLQEELISAEVWERELEERLKRMEEKVMPQLMKFCNQLEREEGVEKEVIEESLVGDDWKKVVAVCRKRVGRVEQMEVVGISRQELQAIHTGWTWGLPWWRRCWSTWPWRGTSIPPQHH